VRVWHKWRKLITSEWLTVDSSYSASMFDCDDVSWVVPLTRLRRGVWRNSWQTPSAGLLRSARHPALICPALSTVAEMTWYYLLLFLLASHAWRHIYPQRIINSTIWRVPLFQSITTCTRHLVQTTTERIAEYDSYHKNNQFKAESESSRKQPMIHYCRSSYSSRKWNGR
jgi:hypothetical protein